MSYPKLEPILRKVDSQDLDAWDTLQLIKELEERLEELEK